MFFRKLFVFSLWFGAACMNTSAQDFDPPLRLEFDMAENKYPMNMELLGQNGLVLFFQKASKEDTKWTVCHYDTNFQVVKMRSVPFETKTVVCATGSDENFFYAVLQNDANNKAETINTYILRYDAATKKIDVFSFYHAERGKILSVVHFGNIFVYSVYSSKSEEHVYVFNTQNLTHTVLHPDKVGACELQDTYPDSAGLWVVSKFYEPKKQTTIRLTQLDANGVVLQEIPLASEGKYNVNSCRIICSNRDSTLLLSGNFIDNEDNRHSTRNNNSGIFTAMIKNGQVEKMLFFEYSSLENWYAISKKSFSNCYDMLYFVAQNDSLVVLASDFYTPEYQQYYANQYFGTGFYSAPALESKLIGFKYQSACLFTFDREGKLIWHNPLNYSELLLKSVRPLLSGCIDSEIGDILYLFGVNNKIFSLIYNKTELVQSIKAITVQPASRFESVNFSEKINCRYWYGNHFIYTAYQSTSKKYGSHSRKNSKYVFGVNKLVYR